MSRAARVKLACAYRYFARCRLLELSRYLRAGVLVSELLEQAEELWSTAASLDGGLDNS